MSISEDIRSRYVSESITTLEACELVVNEFLPGQADQTKPRSLEYAIKELGVTLNVDSAAPFEGRYRKCCDGKPEITLRRVPSDARTRFTLAHEIGHYLIDQVAGSRSMELFRNPVGNESANRDEEFYADVLAASILMPKNQMLEEGVPDLSFVSVDQGMKRFGVSREAYLRRFACVFKKDVVYLSCVPKIFKDHGSMAIVDHGTRLTSKAGYARLRDRAAFASVTPFHSVQKLVESGVEMFLGKKIRLVKGKTSFKFGMIPKVRILAEEMSG